MYAMEVNQQDWDDYAERLTFAINTAHDRVWGDTPFYLIHGWDPRSTLEATLPLGCTKTSDRDPRRWLYHIQRQYQCARATVNDQLKESSQERADQRNNDQRLHGISCGSQVWMYLDRVEEGYARKLAYMWHGPFRVIEKYGEHAVRLEVQGTPYRLFLLVLISKLKLRRNFPDRPVARLEVEENERVDFDEALLPEDSWEGNLAEGEYEVDSTRGVRPGWKTRFGRTHRQFLVRWKGHDDETWMDEANLNCGTLLQEFERDQAKLHRFEVVQLHEEEPRG